ncbi:uncharacterized protein MONBRDRAFT_27870 [Monosiga brevicollis MX1]|uniref:Potassium channel domain-containing protein n=1 Tax=Monosiga brevicollis TaxID=81824 RepID=A9V6Q3_MONBE|nr:uncharacterized protein MONBRDRAFT_27870 [Monosiga brevicollis MX1]EDQ86846.1 predicted protein [Monosiga brevicollis MX1]|eukprot:XP_001748391.1 hypothetical protein [Monosiga brevicollis MX1]
MENSRVAAAHSPSEASMIKNLLPPELNGHVAFSVQQQQPVAQKKRWLSQRFTNRLLLLTVIWQILNISILTLVDKNLSSDEALKHPTADEPAFVAGIAIMVFFQAVQVVVTVAASVKLAKQIMHNTASDSFIVQSYLSTVLLYAGVYTLIHRLDYSSFAGMEESIQDVTRDDYVFLSFCKLLYFSVATMTSTGFGDIYSGKWYMDLVVVTEMLLSVVYNVTIFARGIVVIGQRSAGRANNEPRPHDGQRTAMQSTTSFTNSVFQDTHASMLDQSVSDERAPLLSVAAHA